MIYFNKKLWQLIELHQAPLKPEFKKLINQCTKFGAAIGAIFWALTGYGLSIYLDIPFREPLSNFGTKGWVYIICVILLIAPVIFLTVFMTFISFVLSGKITFTEAYKAAFTFLPPKRWVKDEYKSHFE